MNLNLNEEQRLLREGAERFVTEKCNGELYRRTANDRMGLDPNIWRQFAQLGWLALPIDEAYGGLGGGAVEISILMEAFGRGLVSEPYVSTVVLSAGLIGKRGTEAQRRLLLPQVAEGSLLLALAHSEREARFDLANVATIARRTARGWQVSGTKVAVLDGHAANAIIVSAQMHSPSGSSGGLGLFLVPSDAAGLAISDFPRLGGGRASHLELVNVLLPLDALLGDERDALADIQWAVDHAIAALCAEAAGVMQKLLEMTVEYTGIRKQFGRPLAANQAIRHRLADMAVQCDEARSIALRAALKVESDPIERTRAASGAKAKIGKCARFVGEQSIQLHGAMGVTEELEVGAYFKRLVAFDTMFGGSAHHYRRHAELNRSPLSAN
ncbi:acyl-CoA dehydrogenase family protein [Bradyrhizobium iriomotense]|uniref:acyl-CoA dehydrogenase family protein n=1 Tax=Bradyrhizobium iriomotense TaxID=441950 RepID=UPI001B8A1573|nr:acyl-CoA dehydrogenase family protein [Bradyrhizobium iriomotense]MBR0784724.1 acyl-CoA dehydrogenase family protein [Bradyrhizobium iriomotense]